MIARFLHWLGDCVDRGIDHVDGWIGRVDFHVSQWRHRPGLLYAARIAESHAWSHGNGLGPELNTMQIATMCRNAARRKYGDS